MERRRGDDFVSDDRQVSEDGGDESQTQAGEGQGTDTDAKETDYDRLTGGSPWGWPIGF